jgi:hypothetical protein
MLNKEASEVINTLYRLANQEAEYVKINNNPVYMPVSVEILNKVPWVRRKPTDIIDGDTISICHYRELNGDLMRDPEMIFEKQGDSWIPIYFRNDYLGVEENHPTERQQRSQADFANLWMKNIKEQQNL